MQITSAYDLIDRFDGFLFDAFGVLIDGAGQVPAAKEFLAHLDSIQKPYLVVTNSSREPWHCAESYQQRGLSITTERVVSSGGVLMEWLAEHGDPSWRHYVVGPDFHRETLEKAGYTVVSKQATDFDTVVLGNQNGSDLVAVMEHVISAIAAQHASGRTPRVILPNPDLVYPKSDGQIGMTSGMLALMLQAAFEVSFPGEILPETRLGKPDRPIFDHAIERLGTRRVVMIGDQLSTDIKGAQAAGIDSALVLTGLTRRLSLQHSTIKPTILLQDLCP